MVELSDWQEEKLGNLDAPVSAVLQVLTEIRDLLERNEPTYTAGTAVKTAVRTVVGEPSINGRTQRQTACAVIDRLSWRLVNSPLYDELQTRRADMIEDVLKVLKGEL